MAWLETIRVLASHDRVRRLLAALPDLLAPMVEADEGPVVEAYSHPTLETDVLICIRWPDGQGAAASAPGLILAERLTEYGMVNHTVWAGEQLPIQFRDGRKPR